MELDQLEWKVNVGDSQTYELTQYLDVDDTDGDGDIHSTYLTILDENGHQVNITWKVGSKVKYTVTHLNDSGAYLKRTYDGKITGQEARTTLAVQKTIDNRTFWEEYTQGFSTPTRNASVNGDLIIIEEDIFLAAETLHEVYKFNWRTGWLTYRSQKLYNSSMTMVEIILSKASSGIIPLEFPYILSGVFVLVLFLRKPRIIREA